jgi:hypothetical protein
MAIVDYMLHDQVHDCEYRTKPFSPSIVTCQVGCWIRPTAGVALNTTEVAERTSIVARVEALNLGVRGFEIYHYKRVSARIATIV